MHSACSFIKNRILSNVAIMWFSSSTQYLDRPGINLQSGRWQSCFLAFRINSRQIGGYYLKLEHI